MSAYVRVYWNLHKKMFSIMNAKTGKVFNHCNSVVIDDAQFVVRPAGNKKVREQGKKNVHAFVVGKMQMMDMPNLISDFENYHKVGITYNPYKDTTFVEQNNERTPIRGARQVVMSGYNGRPEVVAWVEK